MATLFQLIAFLLALNKKAISIKENIPKTPLQRLVKVKLPLAMIVSSFLFFSDESSWYPTALISVVDEIIFTSCLGEEEIPACITEFFLDSCTTSCPKNENETKQKAIKNKFFMYKLILRFFTDFISNFCR